MIEQIALFLGYACMVAGGLWALGWLVMIAYHIIPLAFNLRAYELALLGWKTYRKLPKEEKKKYKYIGRKE